MIHTHRATRLQTHALKRSLGNCPLDHPSSPEMVDSTSHTTYSFSLTPQQHCAFQLCVRWWKDSENHAGVRWSEVVKGVSLAISHIACIRNTSARVLPIHVSTSPLDANQAGHPVRSLMQASNICNTVIVTTPSRHSTMITPPLPCRHPLSCPLLSLH